MLHGTGKETFDAVKLMQSIQKQSYTPANGAKYPGGGFGNSLQQIARLIKADVGLEVAFADIGGWDTHVNEVGRAAGRRTARQQPSAIRPVARGLLSGPGRSHGGCRRGHHVRVRTHGAGERQSRNRPWPCERDVRHGRRRPGRQSLRRLARPGGRNNYTKAATWRSPPIFATCWASWFRNIWGTRISKLYFRATRIPSSAGCWARPAKFR